MRVTVQTGIWMYLWIGVTSIAFPSTPSLGDIELQEFNTTWDSLDRLIPFGDPFTVILHPISGYTLGLSLAQNPTLDRGVAKPCFVHYLDEPFLKNQREKGTRTPIRTHDCVVAVEKHSVVGWEQHRIVSFIHSTLHRYGNVSMSFRHTEEEEE